MNMQLKIIYYIRKKKEISLFDLCKKIFRSIKNIGPSQENEFCRYLFDLYYNGLIEIYTRSSYTTNISLEKENTLNKNNASGIVHSAISELYCCHKKTTDDSTGAKNIFLRVTEKYDEVQSSVGFSISYEMQKLKEDAKRNTIFGEINHDLINSQVFVIMPFKGYFKPVYEDHIKKVCDELDYSCGRVDSVNRPSVIINDIWTLINKSEIIICDCTGKNPNVFYELGLAHALGKQVICITQNEEDIPFDIKQIRYIKYDYTPRGMEEFEKTLRRFMITDDISE